MLTLSFHLFPYQMDIVGDAEKKDGDKGEKKTYPVHVSYLLLGILLSGEVFVKSDWKRDGETYGNLLK